MFKVNLDLRETFTEFSEQCLNNYLASFDNKKSYGEFISLNGESLAILII